MIQIAVYAVVVISLVAFGWFKGNAHGTQKLFDYQAKQAQEGAKVVVKQGKVSERVVNRYITVKGKTQTVTQIVEKEVTKYAASNPSLVLDYRFRLLHDAAATNAFPATTGPADGASGAPQAATVLETVASNYAGCHRNADRLDALQSWVKEQGKIGSNSSR